MIRMEDEKGRRWVERTVRKVVDESKGREKGRKWVERKVRKVENE